MNALLSIRQPVRPFAFFPSAILFAVILTSGLAHSEEALPAKVRVGAFDSRLLAVAYTSSEVFKKRLAAMQAELKDAKSKGDQKRVQALQEKGRALQERLHKQGFSTWPIPNILKVVEKDLPLIAKEAKVDLIVSKWDLAYRHAKAEFVDVTPLLVELFHPTEKTRKILESLSKKDPVPLESLKKDH